MEHDPLHGRKVRLRVLEEKDMETLRAWRNRWDIRSAMREFRLIGASHQAAWWDSLRGDDRTLMFGMENEGGRLVGACGLTYIDWHNGHTELTVYVGPTKERRRGYYTDTLEILCRYAFEELRLHMVYGEIYAWNEAAIEACAKRGFRREGPLRDRVFRLGRWWDSYFISMTEVEWVKRHESPGGRNRWRDQEAP